MKYNWDLEKIKQVVPNCINLTEVLQVLEIPRQGNNSKTLRNILDSNAIDYSHFTGRARNYNNKTVPIEEYLSNAKSIGTYALKEKLIKVGLKQNCCECCGISEWRGKKLTIQLHHIDGNHNNNSLENLQMLCPNCHSQTESYCGNANNNKIKYHCKNCGKEIGRGSTYCTVCAKMSKRKVTRPSKEELFNLLINTPNFCEIGRRFGVSEASIRKWCRSYGIPSNIKEYK